MRTQSKDGTAIEFDQAGAGPPLVLIDAALCRRGVGPNKGLGERLRRRFTVITYDRRGRGESGDTAPYDVAREIEDIAALIDAAGGSAYLYGISSGGALALEATRRLPDKVDTVAVYEIPFVVDDSRRPVSESFADELGRLIAADRRGAAVKLFMSEVVGLPGPLVAAMPLFPGWGRNKAMAHTLPYDVAIMGDGQRGMPLTAARWAALRAPVLVASGGKSPDWLRSAAAQLAEVLPGAEYRTLEGQRHYVKPDAIAPVLEEFFAGSAQTARPSQAAS